MNELAQKHGVDRSYVGRALKLTSLAPDLVEAILAGDERFRIEWLLPYAPDLNSVEHVRNHTKYRDLANYVPDDLLDLDLELEYSIDQTRKRPDLLRSFFHAAELKT